MIVALAAFLGPLGYSEIIGFEPCFFCWWQRIFMFPLSLLLSLGVFRKETSIKPYAMLLAGIGACISLYHVLLQWGAVSTSTACGVVGQSVSCSVMFVYQFGYITIPTMALTAFVAILVLLGYQK
ncbi:disulfide bond formation protein B [Candidatus Nomurabacteria bacterium]|nr:disulfide bond formation protein B [Candidatus Nomurabacteria bacterium]